MVDGIWSVSLRYIFLLSMCLVQSVWAGPEVAFLPEVVVMPEIVAGDTARASVVLKNVGDADLVISGHSFAHGRKSAFEARLSASKVSPNDSTVVQVVFRPQSGGAHVDALVLETNKRFDDGSQPIPVVALTGRVLSPEIAVSTNRLIFTGIGKPVSQQVQVSNLGADVLRVSRAFVADRRFAVDAAVFDVAASGMRTLTVTYTPDSSRARTDSLVMESNDYDEARVPIFLEAFGTPRNEGRARLSITRLDTLTYPTVGDTVSAEVFLHTNQDSVGGLEVYVGFNPLFFRSARPDSPFVRRGLTRDSLQVLQNTIVTADAGRRAVYLSAATAVRGRRVLDGVVARLNFVVVAPLIGQTRLRTMTDLSRLNSIYTTPGERAFTLPGSGGLIFGNTPPVFKRLALTQTQEDRSTTLRLGSLATDVESPARDWAWVFSEPTGVLGLSIVQEDTIRRIQFRPPTNGWGTYPVSAIVKDPAGAADTTAIVLQVTPVNDPPNVPELLAPSHMADSLGQPISFVWRASDVDRGDVLSFNFRLAKDSLSLTPVHMGLRDSSLVLDGLDVGQQYYWQITARDKLGVATRSAIWAFTVSGTPDEGFRYAGDLNGDRVVGFADFILFAQAFGKDKGQIGFILQADLNQDDRVAFSDFIIFARLFGTDYTTL